jgi:hypothetical protein
MKRIIAFIVAITAIWGAREAFAEWRYTTFDYSAYSQFVASLRSEDGSDVYIAVSRNTRNTRNRIFIGAIEGVASNVKFRFDDTPMEERETRAIGTGKTIYFDDGTGSFIAQLRHSRQLVIEFEMQGHQETRQLRFNVAGLQWTD